MAYPIIVKKSSVRGTGWPAIEYAYRVLRNEEEVKEDDSNEEDTVQ